MSTWPLILVIALLIASIAALLWSSDRLVEGAAKVATHFGVSPLVIGLTLVSIGTSAPEILVSATAALKGTSDLAVGNAIGSNLANTCMVLGATALVAAIPVTNAVLRKEMLIMIGATAAAGLVLVNGYLGRVESIALLVFMVFFLWLTFRGGTPEEADELIQEAKESSAGIGKATFMVVIGLVGLLLSSDLLVTAAVETATRAGVNELIIGATLVAVGTSLPELSASLSSARLGKTDIALGNILGSNIFNLLIVLPVAGVINPATINAQAFTRDFGVLAVVSVALALFCFVYARKNRSEVRLGRSVGIALLAVYALYYFLVFGL